LPPEQFGGANGEPAAAMPYTVRGINCEHPMLQDLLLDVGTWELSHAEVIGCLARLHLLPTKKSRSAAEARAKIVYERPFNFTTDAGTKEALRFLMTREITHMKAFMLGLESLGKVPLSIGQSPPTPGLVDQNFNDSTGEGEMGQDARGPWNEGNGWQYVEAPALNGLAKAKAK
jgi:Mn-containing catalase